jgi:ATP-dependent helicase/nuclease subunit A
MTGAIPEEKAEFVDAGSIARFLSSGVAERARHSTRMLAEAPFCLKVSAKELSLADSDENVIVQGVIDMCFVEDGQWVIVDYKTDSVKKGQELAAAEKYKTQLMLYEKALCAITGMSVKEKIIYLLSAGAGVSL